MATQANVSMCKGSLEEIKALVRVLIKPPQLVTAYLWSQPGVGKSSAIKQLAKQMAKENGCEFLCLDLRMALLEATDLMGLPVPVGDVTRFLAPRLLPRKSTDGKPGKPGILFLDELNRAREDTINAAFQLILDRKVGEYELPDNWSIIVAGNLGDEDRTLVHEMDSALWNRMFHFLVAPEFDEWKQYMRIGGDKFVCKEGQDIKIFDENEVKDESVVRFLDGAGRKFWIAPPAQEPFGSPRTWDMLQKVVKRLGGATKENLDNIFSMTVAACGNSAALAFRKFCEEMKVIRPEDVLLHLDRLLPEIEAIKKEKRDELYALADSVADLVIQKGKNVSDVEYKNLYKFICDVLDREHSVAISKKLAAEKAPVIDKLCKEKKFGSLVAYILSEVKEGDKKTK